MVVVHMVWIKTFNSCSPEQREAIVQNTRELLAIPGVISAEGGTISNPLVLTQEE